MTIWKDGTLETGVLRIQITNTHIHHKGVWVVHVREFGWNSRYMNIPNDSTEEQAQEKAIDMCKDYLNKALESLI